MPSLQRRRFSVAGEAANVEEQTVGDRGDKAAEAQARARDAFTEEESNAGKALGDGLLWW